MTAAATLTAAQAALAAQLQRLPDEAFTRLQYLCPAAGCFNRCAFCCQAAGRETWQLTAGGLTDVAAALAAVAAGRGLQIAGGRAHRPGVVFPYLDNDIASYPYLDTLCALARDVLGVRLRISTVGYSSRSPHLAAMHQRIAAEHRDVFDGIRLSVTPFTAGWREGAGSDPVSRAQFTADMAAMLATYRPVFDQLGHGPATAAAELRFAPLAGTGPLTDAVIGGRHALGCGPHLLLADSPCDSPLPLTAVERLDDRGQPVLSTPGRPYTLITSDAFAGDDRAVAAAASGCLPDRRRTRRVTVYRFSNADGDYYAADPDFHADGTFTALHLYPATKTRRRSGYTDATRWFLNALLAYKAGRGLGRRAPFPGATQDDVATVLTALDATAAGLAGGIDRAAAGHLRDTVLPLVATYASALGQAGYPPSTLFSRDFTIDTGQIINQGRAKGLFRGLASTDDEPMTPREERGFGAVSLSSARGTIWRLAPAPTASGGPLPVSVTGVKNTATPAPALVVEELDPRHLRPVMRSTGKPLRRYTITGVGIEHRTLDQARAEHGYPGLVASRNSSGSP